MEAPALRSSRLDALAVGSVLAGAWLVALSLAFTPTFPFWPVVVGLGAAFALADRCEALIEVGDQTIAATLGEALLVAALFFFDPATIALAYVLGTLPSALLHRHSPAKVAINLGSAAIQGGGTALLAAALAQRLSTDGSTLDPGNLGHWLVALGSVHVAIGAATVLIGLAMRWSGAPDVRLLGLVGLGALSTTGDAVLGLLAAALADLRPVALVLLAALVGVLIVLHRTGAANLRRLERMRQLYEFTRVLANSPGIGETARVSMERAMGALRCERIELVLLDPGGPRTWLRLDGEGVLEVVADEWGADRTLADVVADGRPRITKDALVVPMRGDDTVVGAMVARHRRMVIDQFEVGDLEVFEAIANHAAVSLERDQLVERLRDELREKEHLALHDTLTGLPNRRAFVHELAEAVRSARSGGEPVSVLAVDLNGFKDVNDTLGHQTGDQLLVDVARRLERVCGAHGTVARLGGDEFALLVRLSGDDAVALGAAAIAAVGSPFALAHLQIGVGCSVGIASAPEHATDHTTLLQRADLALYAAKDRRTPEPHVYDSTHDRLSARRLSLASELRGAIERRELSVVYQPKADIRTGRIVGVESLLRWTHPELGFVPPDEFIAIAEQTGAIEALTRFVLTEAVQTVSGWSDRGEPLHVAVNVSTRNLPESRLADVIAGVLETFRLPPERLTLEITETELMQDADLTLTTLGRLHDMGIRLSIDDFGTGYSSLAYLKKMPVDEVKIDKSFIMGLSSSDDDEAIARTIVELARGLGLKTVAEGVEDQRVWDLLRSMGCDVAQGYFLSRPIPPADLERWLSERAVVDV